VWLIAVQVISRSHAQIGVEPSHPPVSLLHQHRPSPSYTSARYQQANPFPFHPLPLVSFLFSYNFLYHHQCSDNTPIQTFQTLFPLVYALLGTLCIYIRPPPLLDEEASPQSNLSIFSSLLLCALISLCFAFSNKQEHIHTTTDH
jgi:hypothetical protein